MAESQFSARWSILTSVFLFFALCVGATFATDISSCQAISSPGTYVLTTDVVSTSGPCFTITADDVVLDCAGHTVTMTMPSFHQQGTVSVGSTATVTSRATVQNCNIVTTNPYFSDISSVRLTFSNGAVIKNNTMNFGIIMSGCNSNTIVSNTIGKGSRGVGSWLSGGSNNLITNNTITSVDTLGLFLSFSTGNSITGNTITTDSTAGSSSVILLDRSERNNVANNKIVASSAASGIGIYGGAGTNVTSNTITVNHSDSSCTWGCGLGSKTTGVVISDSSGVSMMGNQVSLSGTDSDGSLHGVWVVGSSSNGVIDSNTISGAAQVGVFIDGTGSSAILSNNKVNGNTISGASTGVKISSAVGATVSDNIIANSANTIVVLSSTSTVINGNTLTDNVLPEPVIDTASAATITIDVPFRPFDSDGDGVNDDVDACSGSIIDAGPVAGTYAWLGGLYLKTADQKTKQVVDSTYSMVQTNGCTCAQIVASKAGSDKGQLKNGCTRGTMENYIAQKGSIKPSLLNAMFDGLSDAFVVIGLLVALVVGYLVGKRK